MSAATYYTAERWVGLLQELAARGHNFLTLPGLQSLSGLGYPSARRAVQRLEAKHYLSRAGKALYANRFGQPTLEELAMILGRPCYISNESALERYGLLAQMPLTLTCVSTDRSGRHVTPFGEIAFHRLKPALFFGYRSEQGILWAEPEKALLDWLYLQRKRHGVTPALDELNVALLDPEKLRVWAENYPRPVWQSVSGLEALRSRRPVTQ